MVNVIANLKWLDIFDILLISLVVYNLYILFHKTKGFRILISLSGLAIIYIMVKSWGLFLSTWVFQAFWQALIVLIIIVFQPEIRQVLERINILYFFRGKKMTPSDSSKLEAVSRAAFKMAQEKIGAIIIFQKKDDITDIIRGGILLDGNIDESILFSFFQKSSPVHDGAVLIDKGRIKLVAGYLPMTIKETLPVHYGSRHRASLGISEQSDAVIIVVSEQKGKVSIVHEGTMKKVTDESELCTTIQEYLWEKEEKKSFAPFSTLSRLLLHNWFVKLVSFLIVFIFWALLAGQQNYSQNLIVPLEYKNIPASMELVSPPQKATISITGVRKLVHSLRTDEISLEVDVSLAQWGRRTYSVSEDNISLPAGIQLLYIDPSIIRLDFRIKPTLENNS
ncbi:MAG: diadenylate cyclase [bacterium]